MKLMLLLTALIGSGLQSLGSDGANDFGQNAKDANDVIRINIIGNHFNCLRHKEKVTECKDAKALGMQSRAIPDARITASSMWDGNHAPWQGRLHYRPPKGKAGAWATRPNKVGEYLQVALGKITKITAIATQGRYDTNEWVTSYSLQYSIDGKVFKNYKARKVFIGNKDRHTVVKHDLHPLIIARYVRVVIKSWRGHINMRMELYGC